MFDLILKKQFFIFFFLFLISRLVIFFYIGHNNIPDFFHFSDINLLKDNLIETLTYLHSQPLLLNFIIGIILKITDGNLNYFSYIFYFLNLSFSIGIIIYSQKILKIFGINKKLIFFIMIFLIINPNIIYYENYSNPLYAHLVCFLFFQLTYCLFKFFKERIFKFELYIYLNLLLLSSIWSAWQPYLILIVYFLISLIRRNFNKKSFIAFFICFFIALLPSIKNKILFDSFSNSSWVGIYLSTVFVPEPECAKHKYIKKIDIENAKKKFPPKYFTIKSLWGDQSEENNLAIIFKSKRCLEYAVNRIKNNPTEYIKNRLIQFIVSHSKFGFENVRATPDVGKPYWIIKYLDKFDSKFKIFKQVLIILYMLFVYIFLICVLFLKKLPINIKSCNLIFLLIYLYYLAVTHLPNGGYETTRMIYGGFIIQIIFLANLFNLLKFSVKN